MPELIAQGSEPHQRWRLAIPEGEAVIVGRRAGKWSIPWDDHISRHHASVELSEQGLLVEKLEAATNSLFYQGQPLDRVAIQVGQHFVIGGTVFTYVDEPVRVAFDFPLPVTEQTYSSAFLRRLSYRDSATRVEVLSSLPDMIAKADDYEQLTQQLVNLLMSGIPSASSIAVVEASLGTLIEESDSSNSSSAVNSLRGNSNVASLEKSKEILAEPNPSSPANPTSNVESEIDAHVDQAPNACAVRVLHWDRRQQLGTAFTPSRRLVQRSLECGESVLHVWDSSSVAEQAKYTFAEEMGWSFATPVRVRGGQTPEASDSTWVIYVAGQSETLGSQPASGGPHQMLQEDLKFTEVVAATVAQVLELRRLERNQSSLRQFFSPVVLSALAQADAAEILEPRETDVAVLFCDLQGFSRATEQEAHDLMGLLRRVSHVLGLTTQCILEHQGVVGDFHGDATMGFWGWPLSSESYVLDACRAALAIRSELLDPESPTAQRGLQLGLGLATGRAVAGKIGTADQVKVTVFGPVVNLASRLESLTRRLRASILIDEQTADVIRRSTGAEFARVRRVAPVLPYGFNQPLMVHELLPLEGETCPLNKVHLEAYEAAVDAFLEGDWNQAWHHLHEVPAEDEVKDFLTIFIAQHNRQPPENWDSYIRLEGK